MSTITKGNTVKHFISSIRRRIRRAFKNEHPQLRHSETLWTPGWGPYRLEKVPGSNKPMAFWRPDDHEQTNAGSQGFKPVRSVNHLKRLWFAIKMAAIKIAWHKELRAARRYNEQRFDTLIAGRVSKNQLKLLNEGLSETQNNRIGLDYAQRDTQRDPYRHTN